MERLGLGPDICHQQNSKLIYARLTGWGQTGPLATVAGHEPNYSALSGALWYGGRTGQPPAAPLTIMSDVGAGSMSLIIGILAALLSQNTHSKGQVIDASIADSSAYNSTLLWSLFNMTNLEKNFGHNWVDGAAPWNDTYQCKDKKFITICALEPKFYQLLLTTLDINNPNRMMEQWDKSSWPEMKTLFTHLFLSQSQSHWCDLLEGTDCCFAPVLDFSEAPKHPHNRARETFTEINGITQPSPVPKFSNTKLNPGKPPKRAQHTDEILHALGLSEHDIEKLRSEGVI